MTSDVSSVSDPQCEGRRRFGQAKQLTVDSVLANMHYFRVHTATEQRALLNSLEKFLNSHQHVRLVVIDSIAFHFRQVRRDPHLVAASTRTTNGNSVFRLCVSVDLACKCVISLCLRESEAIHSCACFT